MKHYLVMRRYGNVIGLFNTPEKAEAAIVEENKQDQFVEAFDIQILELNKTVLGAAKFYGDR